MDHTYNNSIYEKHAKNVKLPVTERFKLLTVSFILSGKLETIYEWTNDTGCFLLKRSVSELFSLGIKLLNQNISVMAKLHVQRVIIKKIKKKKVKHTAFQL